MMRKFRSIPRLTIIFILAVTIPGGLLSYLSIQNITNLKELAESRVLEEEKTLAAVITSSFNEQLDSLMFNFMDVVSSMKGNDYNSLRLADSMAYLENPFIMDKEGSFLWPVFNPEIEYEAENFNAGFTTRFSAAERYEFGNLNYSMAMANYKRALSLASEERDSAKAMNAMARLYHKMGDTAHAVELYHQLITCYGTARDIYGLPYIYYALPQLLDVANTGYVELVFDAINITLRGMDDGSVPLNLSSEMIMQDIAAWMEQNRSAGHDYHHEQQQAVNRINDRISFLLASYTVLRDFVFDEDNVFLPRIAYGFFVIKVPASYGDERIMVVSEIEKDRVAGFVIGIDSLAYHSADIASPLTYSFAYDVIIIPSNNDSIFKNDGLSVRVQLNPAVTNKSLLVRLKDEDLLKKDIRRTSWIYGVAITLLLGGMLLGVFLIIRDINREKRLSQLRSDFVSNVTHELKTPLTSIYMFAESMLLDRVKTKSDQKEYLSIILKETERLKRLINNILDFSKKEEGRLIYNFTTVNISGLVRSALHELDYWISEKQFRINTMIQDDIIANADPDALKQAILNLLSNALKYSREDKEISVNLYRKGGIAFLEVIDKGIGIPEDKQHRIFDKFYRIANDDDTENTGTGLGLTVVKEILDAHDASINVESTPGKGSKFTIILKLE